MHPDDYPLSLPDGFPADDVEHSVREDFRSAWRGDDGEDEYPR